jgi:hypothetical protein
VKGQRLSSAAKRLDVVVVAARYAPDGKLTVAQGYERRGQVWTDLLLLDRPTLIGRLRAGRRVAAGEPRGVPGDFVVRDALVLSGADGRAVVRASHTSSSTDNLGVPTF